MRSPEERLTFPQVKVQTGCPRHFRRALYGRGKRVGLVPPSIRVPAGAARASFTPLLAAVTSLQRGTITARYQSSGQRVPIAVHPGGMALLTLTPASTIGGQPVTAEVSFVCPAGMEGRERAERPLSESAKGVKGRRERTIRPGGTRHGGHGGPDEPKRGPATVDAPPSLYQ